MVRPTQRRVRLWLFITQVPWSLVRNSTLQGTGGSPSSSVSARGKSSKAGMKVLHSSVLAKKHVSPARQTTHMEPVVILVSSLPMPLSSSM